MNHTHLLLLSITTLLLSCKSSINKSPSSLTNAESIELVNEAPLSEPFSLDELTGVWVSPYKVEQTVRHKVVAFVDNQMLTIKPTKSGHVAIEKRTIGWSEDFRHLLLNVGRKQYALSLSISDGYLIFDSTSEHESPYQKDIKVLSLDSRAQKTQALLQQYVDTYNSEEQSRTSFIDSSSLICTKPIYSTITSIPGFSPQNKHYYVNIDGKVSISGNGISNGYYGVINNVGESVVPIQHEGISSVETLDKENPVRFLVKDSLWYLYNSKDSSLSEEGYDYISNFRNGYASVNRGGTQSISIPFKREEVRYGSWAVIDSTGKEVIPFEPAQGLSYSSSGKLIIRNEQLKYGLYTMKRKELIPPLYDSLFDRGTLFIAVQNNAEAVIDERGKFIIPLTQNLYCKISGDTITTTLTTESDIITQKYDLRGKRVEESQLITNTLKEKSDTPAIVRGDFYSLRTAEGTLIIDSMKQIKIFTKNQYEVRFPTGEIGIINNRGEELFRSNSIAKIRSISESIIAVKEKESPKGSRNNRVKLYNIDTNQFLSENRYRGVYKEGRYFTTQFETATSYGLNGIIDSKGTLLVPPLFDRLTYMGETATGASYIYHMGRKKGLIHITHEIGLDPQIE